MKLSKCVRLSRSAMRKVRLAGYLGAVAEGHLVRVERINAQYRYRIASQQRRGDARGWPWRW
jgi:hypothetical protein